jgi:hypothetical protein
MVTNRTPIRRSSNLGITPAVIALWKRARESYDDGGNIYELNRELERLLHRQEPWKTSLFACVGVDKPPDWMKSRTRLDDWHEAFRIVDALDRAAGLKP